MKQLTPGSTRGSVRHLIGLAFVLTLALILAGTAQAQPGLVKVSTDTFSNNTSQHATEVEPDTFAFGSTLVSTFQVGRIASGGSSDIGFATSTDGGNTWNNGFLPGITTFYQGGTFPSASDPSVAYDAAHGVWIIVSLGVASVNAVLVSSSPDGINWSNPVTVDNRSSFADKEWIACDSTASSAFYGHCYVEWDDFGIGEVIKMSTSTDGGLTWSAPKSPANAFGSGGQPVVQPSGTVVVPYEGSGIQAFTSTNGGTSWNSAVNVASISEHGVHGGMRTGSLPSAEVDGAGKVYVVWQDCRFRSGCSANDIVMSTSTNGTSWSAVTRIPIDATTSTVDHFIPGIAADPPTSGSTAHLGLTYYFFPVSNCTTATCSLTVGFISSQDGGATWNRPKKLGGPMRVSWLPSTTSGRMVGDYISTSYVNGKAFSVFAIAKPKVGSIFDEGMYTTVTGLGAERAGNLSSAGDKPVPHATSDYRTRRHINDERIPKPPLKR